MTVDAQLVAEVMNNLGAPWHLKWFDEPYEGWNAVLSIEPGSCFCNPPGGCYCCDGVNVTREQVEAMLRAGVEFAETAAP